MDTDELDDEENLAASLPSETSRDRRMPLLVGLLDTSHRRSLDLPLRLSRGDNDEEYNLEEIRAKRTAGGGLLDSVANMANSILGAGA